MISLNLEDETKKRKAEEESVKEGNKVNKSMQQHEKKK